MKMDECQVCACPVKPGRKICDSEDCKKARKRWFSRRWKIEHREEYLQYLAHYRA